MTSSELAMSISGTSSNSNAVTTLDAPFADPDDEALRGWLDEGLSAAAHGR